MTGLTALLAVATIAAPGECASRGSETLRETALVRVYERTSGGDRRMFVACDKRSDRRRMLVREPRGERFHAVRTEIRGTRVTLRYRTPTTSCTRKLDVVTGDGAMQCVA